MNLLYLLQKSQQPIKVVIVEKSDFNLPLFPAPFDLNLGSKATGKILRQTQKVSLLRAGGRGVGFFLFRL
jgi:hypothetical protein